MKYLTYTTWHRDRGGKLVLRQRRYRVVARPHVLERGLALRDGALATLTAAVWFFAVLCIALSAQGCASADGHDSPPESSSPGAQTDSMPRNWCCAASDPDGKRVLVCGIRELMNADHCYCAGIVRGSECIDETAWTPGTICTRAALVCFEEE